VGIYFSENVLSEINLLLQKKRDIFEKPNKSILMKNSEKMCQTLKPQQGVEYEISARRKGRVPWI